MLYPRSKNAVFERKKSLDFHLSFFLVPRAGIEPALVRTGFWIRRVYQFRHRGIKFQIWILNPEKKKKF